MSFTDYFDYDEMERKVQSIYDIIVYNWDEYNPSVCDDEDELEKLGKELLNKLTEIEDIIEKMNKINVDSYGC